MKVITEQYMQTLVDNIIKERQKQLGESFSGISGADLCGEITNYLGDQWVVKKEEQVKFSRSDINAVAGARFYRKTGLQLLMGMAIVILLIASVTRYIPLTELGYNIAYTLCGLIALVFIIVYSRKQSKARKELWHQIGREEDK